MKNKWKARVSPYGIIDVQRGCEDYTLHENFETLLSAKELAADLNELEALREERRWRKIGEEWPEYGQECQLATTREISFYSKWKWIYINRWRSGDGATICGASGKPIVGTKTLHHKEGFTHWRPAPVDVPRREG